MKQKIGIFAYVALLFLVISCKKDDYREKYMGNWIFDVQVAKLNVDSIPQFVKDTISFAGLISKGNNKDEINIHYLEDTSIILKLNEAGELSGFPTASSGGSGNGEFVGFNKVYLNFKWGGQGGFLEHNIIGNKK